MRPIRPLTPRPARRAIRIAAPDRRRPTSARRALAVGAVAGVVAAATVACWYLAADLAAGRPFFTPERLGASLAGAIGLASLARSTAGAVALYTLVHLAGFVAWGVAAAAVVRGARRQPTVLAGALLVAAIVEVAFAGTLAVLSAGTSTGALTWVQLAVGHLLGVACIALVTVRAYPGLGAVLAVALGAGDRRSGSWPARA
jgi:hypothetical protein